MASMRRLSAISGAILGSAPHRQARDRRREDRKPTRRLVDYSRVQVCDLHRTFSTQPFMLSELPETVPEPL